MIFSCYYQKSYFWNIETVLIFLFKVRCSHPDLFCKTGILKNFTEFRGKHLRWRILFNKCVDPYKRNSDTNVFLCIFQIFKLACVVKLKLAFIEWFFYNLVILIKLYKIRYLNLDKALLFPRNQAICLKNWKLWRAPTTTKFNIFCWNLHMFTTWQCLQKDVLNFFNFP